MFEPLLQMCDGKEGF